MPAPPEEACKTILIICGTVIDHVKNPLLISENIRNIV